MPTSTFAVTRRTTTTTIRWNGPSAISNHSDRFNLLINGIDRVESLGSRAVHTHGMDAPEINHRRWTFGHGSANSSA